MSNKESTEPTIFDLWRLHSRGEYFLSRGGNDIPPPRAINLTLTNKCNLRCTVCGSQGLLDATKTPRHHMKIETFRRIAETLFPFLVDVELNSRGEPLLYPHIDEVFETMQKHQCAFRIQHNGTLLNDTMIERLCSGYGTLSLSIDAVSPLFDQVRLHGQWEKVEAGLKKMAAQRDASKVYMMFYPTVTARTVGEMLPIVQWAQAHDIDSVHFHDYEPVPTSTEQKPDTTEKRKQLDAIATFLQKENASLSVYDQAQKIHEGREKPRAPHPSPMKNHFRYLGYVYPLEADHPQANPHRLCPAPWKSLDIGIEGEISPCCRSQLFSMGRADDVETFAAVWLGKNYCNLRASLSRAADRPAVPLPACKACLAGYAPREAKQMKFISYTNNQSDNPNAFVCDRDSFAPTLFFRETAGSNVYKAYVPLGMTPDDYALFEDGSEMQRCPSAQDVQANDTGCYGFADDNSLAIQASDGSNPISNGRTYSFKRVRP